VQEGGRLTSQVLEGTTPVASPPMTYVQTPAGAIVAVPTSTVIAAVAHGSRVIGTVSPTGAPATLLPVRVLESSETRALQGTTESSGSPWAFLTDLPTWEVAAIVGAVLLLVLLLAVL
jgi:hypothetical protein